MRKNKIIAALIVLAMLLCLCGAAAAEPVYGEARLFSIPTRTFSVLLKEGGSDAQGVVDDKTTAAILELEGYTPIIADHWCDGMSTLYTVQTGDVAYIEDAEGNRTWYTYLSTHICVNTGYQLLSEGEDLAALRDSSLLLTYTCNGDGKTVTVVLWQMLDEEPKL